VGASEAEARGAQEKRRLEEQGMVKVENSWKGLGLGTMTGDDAYYRKDSVIDDIEQVNGRWVWKDFAAYERHRNS
jgi:hypothetical protein